MGPPQCLPETNYQVWSEFNLTFDRIDLKWIKNEKLVSPKQQLPPESNVTEGGWRQNHILGDKLFSDEHREQLWLIFAQKFSDWAFTRTECAFNTAAGSGLQLWWQSFENCNGTPWVRASVSNRPSMCCQHPSWGYYMLRGKNMKS